MGWQGSPIANPQYMTKAKAALKLIHKLPQDLPHSQMLCWEFFPATVAYGLCIAIWRAWDGQKQSGKVGKWMTRQLGAYVCCLVIRWCLNASLALRWRKILTQKKPWCYFISCSAVSMEINLLTCLLVFCCGLCLWGFFSVKKIKIYFSLHVVREVQEQFRSIFK